MALSKQEIRDSRELQVNETLPLAHVRALTLGPEGLR